MENKNALKEKIELTERHIEKIKSDIERIKVCNILEVELTTKYNGFYSDMYFPIKHFNKEFEDFCRSFVSKELRTSQKELEKELKEYKEELQGIK